MIKDTENMRKYVPERRKKTQKPLDFSASIVYYPFVNYKLLLKEWSKTTP